MFSYLFGKLPLKSGTATIGTFVCASRLFSIYHTFVYTIHRLIHGHFHIGLAIIPRPPYWLQTESKANMGRGLITRPIWKCPCIKLFITYFQHLERRHPYWPEKKSRPILTRANMGLDMEMIL